MYSMGRVDQGSLHALETLSSLGRPPSIVITCKHPTLRNEENDNKLPEYIEIVVGIHYMLSSSRDKLEL